MRIRVLIMRHGEAESLTPGGSDAERSLSDHGHRQAEQAGRVLYGEELVPDVTLASPYRRAQQTAAAVASAMGLDQWQTESGLVPEADAQATVEALAGCDASTLLLVSHQPLVTYLLAALTCDDVLSMPRLAPASLALLHADDLLPGCCDLVWHRHSPDFIPVR